jgi:hypothetical protein
MKRLFKIVPLCAAALLFTAAVPGLAAADHGRNGGSTRGQHEVTRDSRPAGQHMNGRNQGHRYGYRQYRQRGHGYGYRNYRHRGYRYGQYRRYYAPPRWRHRVYYPYR